MIRSRLLRPCKSAISATAVLLLLSACLIHRIGAQSIETASNVPKMSRSVTAALQPPSPIPLAHDPTSLPMGDLTPDDDCTLKSSQDFADFAGDIEGHAHVDLAIANSSADQIGSPLLNGDRTFKTARVYRSDFQPRAIASGDLTGDGRSGLVVANSCPIGSNGGSVAVLLADSNGVYHFSASYSLDGDPVSVAVADLNDDGNLDIITLNRAAKTLSVLRGVGDGTFFPPFKFALANAPVAFAIGDFNTDGRPDIAVLEDCGIEQCAETGKLEILLGTNDGGLRSEFTYSLGDAPKSIAVGDMNGDNNLDIVVADICGNDRGCKSPGTATVFIGDGTGKFTARPEIELGNRPSAIALGDLWGRGILDLVVSRAAENSLAVFAGNGDGSFGPPVVYKVGASPSSVAIADFNGDGKQDVAVSNFEDSNVSVLLGNGDGSLQPANSYPVASGPGTLTLIAGIQRERPSLAVASGNRDPSATEREFTVLQNVGHQDKLVSRTLLSSSPNPSAVGEQVTLTAIVTGSGSSIPTGKVTFRNNGVAIPHCTDVDLATKRGDKEGKVSCVAAFPKATDSGTEDSLTADYGGNQFFGPSVSKALAQIVELAATLRLTASKSPSNVDESVTFTARVTPDDAQKTPSGKVSFTINGIASKDCTLVSLNANGKAVCGTSVLTAGEDTIKASYSDDPVFVADPVTLTQTVNPLSAYLSLTAAPSASVTVGTSVTFTAVLAASLEAPIAPTGTVSFTIDGEPSADCPAKKVADDGMATCVTSQLTTPSDEIVASYADDPNFTVKSSASLTQSVVPLSATLRVTPSIAKSNVNEQVTFTAVISANSVTPIAPSGTLSFTINGKPSADCPAKKVATDGKATCVTSQLTAPSDEIVASYADDPNFTVKSSASLTQTVNPLTASLSLSVSPGNFVSVGTSVTLTAVLAASLETPIAPTGTVSFTINGKGITDCPPIPLENLGTGKNPQCSTESLPAGLNQIQANYSDDPNFSPTTSKPLTETVLAVSLSVPQESTLTLTQGFSNTDPFNPAPITETWTPTGVELPESLTVSCSLKATGNSTQGDGPHLSCSATPPPSGSQKSSGFSISAASDSAVGQGSYIATLLVSDGKVAVPVASETLEVNVVDVAQVTTVVAGTSITQPFVPFIAADGSVKDGTETLATFNCGVVVAKSKMGQAFEVGAALASQFQCSSPSGQQATISGGVTTPIQVTIAIPNSTMARVNHPSAIFAAEIMGGPVLALVAWLGGWKPSRRRFFRLIALYFFFVGLSSATACTNGFHDPNLPSGSNIPDGEYYVQVTAVDTNKISYYAVIALNVVSN